MDRIFETTTVIQEASMTVKKRGFIKVTLIFLLVYGIGSLLSSALLSVPMFGYIFDYISNNSEMTEAINNGDYVAYEEAYMNAVTEMTSNLPDWITAFSLLATAGVIVVTIFYCTKLERRRLFTLGFVKKGAIPEYFAGLGIGLVMFSAAYGIIILSGQATFNGFNAEASIPTILFFFVGFLVQGMSEEVLFRGYYFVSGSCSRNNIALAIFISSAFFALFHGGNNGISVMAMLNLFLFGIFAALYFLRRGSIWGIAAIHSVWNFAQGNIFGCAVSGTSSGSALLTTTYVGTNTLFNGGAFGPEGGLGVTIVLFIGIVILLIMKNKEIMVQYNGEFYSA